MKEVKILVFGDSISYGAWDLKGGWVQSLRTYLDRISLQGRGYYEIYNLGVSGDTSTDIVERFENEAKARISKGDHVVVIFAFGTNDCLVVNATGECLTPLDIFRKNVSTLIKRARRISQEIIFIGDTPVDESRMNPLKWAPQYSANNNAIKKYNDEMKEICKASEIHFIDMLEYFTVKDQKRLLADGDHPNSKGHDRMHKIIMKYLTENRII